MFENIDDIQALFLGIAILIKKAKASGDSAKWGQIAGTLADQTDLNNALGSKQDTISDLENIRNNASDAESKAHTHSNKALLDTYLQTENNLADAVDKKHSHSNKSTLDGISANDVSNWNGKENAGKITIGGVEKTASSADLVITDNGVTTTYKVVVVS